jgi:DNA repair exonuclease SbcCD ATPase subunit
MEIRLQNFRCHRDRTFVFHRGLNLIDGSSGVGKSTILEAIHYLLVGKTRNVCTRGEKKCAVTMRWNDLVIQRTKMPTRLTIQPLGLEDDAAQAHLFSLIGGEEFELTSYMLQKGTSQFFTLPSAEKRRFIESLGAGRSSLAERIASETKRIRGETVRHETSLRLLRPKEEVVRPAARFAELRTPDDATQALECARRTEARLHDEQRRLDGRWAEVSRLLAEQSAGAERARTLADRKERLDGQIRETRKAVEELEEDPEEGKRVDTISAHESYLAYKKKREEIQEKKKVYEQMVQHEEARHAASISDLESKRTVLPPGEVASAKAEYDRADAIRKRLRRRKEIEERIRTIPKDDVDARKKELEERTAFLAEMEGRKNVQSCPHCEKGLVVQQSLICRASATPISAADAERIRENRTALPECKKRYEEAQRNKIVREQLESELGPPVEGEEEVEETYRRIRSKIEEYGIVQQRNKLVDSGLAELRAQVPKEKYRPLRTQLEQGIAALGSMPKGEFSERYEESVRRRAECAERTIRADQLRRQLRAYESERAEAERERMETKEIDYAAELEEIVRLRRANTDRFLSSRTILPGLEAWSSFVARRLEQKQRERLHEFHRARLHMLGEEGMALERFARRVVEAEHKCMEETIDLINAKVKTYLEQFFQDPMLMTIETEKEAKNGKVKPELAVAIEYKGAECDLTSLSGGEYDRCALAFMLAINELSSSPFLILDESISSLDMGSSETVLDVLKESAPDKIVLLVSHQANTGMFDHVIGL